MGGHLPQDLHHLTPSSTWDLTLEAGDFIEDVGEEGETGLPNEDVEEVLIWTIGEIATHAVGLKRVAGVGIVMTETGWIEWIVMLTQIPDAISETNAVTPEIANCSETSWKLAPTLAMIQDFLVRRYHRLLLRRTLQLSHLQLAED
jgi:hypothetical protein